MPMARRSKNLVRRPHVGKTHFGARRDLAFGVSRLHSLSNLVECLAVQSQFCPKFVIRQYGSYSLRVETDRRSELRVINDGMHLNRSERRSNSKPAHDHAHKAVVPLVYGLVTRRGKNSDGCAIGDSLRGRALGQRNFRVTSHHVLAEWRGLFLPCPLFPPTPPEHHQKEQKTNFFIHL